MKDDALIHLTSDGYPSSMSMVMTSLEYRPLSKNDSIDAESHIGIRDFEFSITFSREQPSHSEMMCPRIRAEDGDTFIRPTIGNCLSFNNHVIRLELVTNKLSRVSGCIGKTRADCFHMARHTIWGYVNVVMNHLALRSCSPIFIYHIEIRDDASRSIQHFHTSPFLETDVNVDLTHLRTEEQQLAYLFRDALSTPNPFLRSLRFFNVIEGVYQTRESRAVTEYGPYCAANESGYTDEVFPNLHELNSPIARRMFGERIYQFYESEDGRELRNAVAHYSLTRKRTTPLKVSNHNISDHLNYIDVSTMLMKAINILLANEEIYYHHRKSVW